MTVCVRVRACVRACVCVTRHVCCGLAGITFVCCSAQHQAENQRRRDARAARAQAARERQRAAAVSAAAATVSGRDPVFAAGRKFLTPALLGRGGSAQYAAPRPPPSAYVPSQAGPLPTPGMHDCRPETAKDKLVVAPEPEPEAEPYSSKAQVAGHPDGIRFEGGVLLKRLQGAGKHESTPALAARREAMPSRGEKEARFLLQTAPAHSFLRDRVPVASEIRTHPDGSRWIVMDSLTAGFKTPAILDIKMGTLTCGPGGARTVHFSRGRVSS